MTQRSRRPAPRGPSGQPEASAQGISLQLGALSILLALLWAFQAQIVNPAGLTFMLPIALSIGAVGIFAGGVWNLRNGVTIAGVIGGLYGVFWMSFGLLLLIEATPLTKSLGGVEFSHLLGLYLWIWAVVSAALAASTWFVNRSVFAQQAVLALVFVFLGIGYSSAPGGSGMLKVGGWLSLVDAAIAVVGQLSDPATLVDSVRGLEPDVALVDIGLGGDCVDDGLRTAIALRRLTPRTGVLVISHHLEERFPLELIGADPAGVGYLLKTRIADVESFVESVRRVAAGGSALDSEVVARMMGRRRQHHPVDALSQREREVLAAMAQGRSNHGISVALQLSTTAVEKYITAVFSKLGLRDEPQDHRRVLAVLRLLRAR